MTEDAALTLYAEMLAPLVPPPQKGSLYPTPETIYSGLRSLSRQRPGLTPGDFRAVRASFAFAAPEKRTHDALLDALRAAVACKGEQNGRRMGFGQG